MFRQSFSRVRSRGAVLIAAAIVPLLLGAHSAAGGDGADRPAKTGPVVLTVTPFLTQAKAGEPSRADGASGAAAAAAPTSPPFTECPPIGLDTSCGVLVVVTDSGGVVLSDPSQPPFDGIEDTLTGIVNNSSGDVSFLALSSNTDLFGFDGDGLCTQSGAPAGCPFGPTGYEGPGTSFSDINPDASGGIVHFSPALAPGQTAYFSLEEALTSAIVFAGGPTTDEQGGAPNGSENPTVCSSGEPVNCATGVFWHRFADLGVPGRGVPLGFVRTYSSSAASSDGPLGFGWTHDYAMSLSIDATTGNVTVRQEDGATVTFVPSGSSFIAAPRVLATLRRNGDGTYTFTRTREGIGYTFSAAGVLQSAVDRNGYATTFAYDGSGRLTTVTDPAGRTLTLAYAGTHVVSVTDPAGRTESFSYDAAGNLVTATDPAGGQTSFAYDANHLLLSMTDPRGSTTTNAYDSSKRVVSQTDPLGRRTTWSFTGNAASPAGGTTTITDPKGTASTFQYQNLELLSVTRAAGTPAAATATYTYDPATLGRTSVTDPNGHKSTATYDGDGNAVSFTDALNRRSSATYNAFAEPLAMTDPSGVTTTRTYDSRGNLLSVSRPLGTTATQTLRLTYGDAAHPGDATAVTDPNGGVTRFTYDAFGDTSSVTDAVGNTRTLAYDGVGQVTSVTSARGNSTSYQYDALGRLTRTTDPLGHASTQTYDAASFLKSSTDGNGNTTRYAYDAAGQLTSVTRADGTTLRYGYDADGNQTGQTDGAGKTTTYAFDAFNRVVSVTDPLGRATSFSYDAAGNRTGLTNPSGRTTAYAYDAANQVTSISYSDGRTPNVSLTYTANGQRASMTDGTGTSTYSYNSLNRLTRVVNGAGKSVSYGYDLNGNETSLTYPNGSTITRSYDNAGRLIAITDWFGHTTTFALDADGNTTTATYPNGVVSSTAYDAAGTISEIDDVAGGSNIASFSYTRDANRQVTSTTPTGTGQGGHESYAYDSLNRLTAVNSAGYAYDVADNLTRLLDGTALSYDAANELTRITPATGPATSISYDQQGNRLNGLAPGGAATNYAYDQADRLTAAGNGGSTVLAGGQFHSLAVRNDGTVWAWGYNADGELGNGGSANRLTPGQVPGVAGASAVAAGDLHSLALAGGVVKSWGSNAFGQLGDGTTTTRRTAVSVSGLGGVTAIAAGNYHSLALRADGTVAAWGYNGSGELGDGTFTNRSTPVTVQGLSGVTAIAGGGLPGWAGHSVALKNDGTVWTWGYGKHGELGNGSTSSLASAARVPGLSGVAAIAASGDNTYALKNDGTVWAWGDDGYGQLGNTGVKGSLSSTPVQVAISGVASIAAGGTHALAIKTDGTVWAWGNNNTGQLGDGGACGKTCTTPVRVTGLTGATQVAGGYVHSLASISDGTVKGWGRNAEGEVGDGTTVVRATPTTTSGLTGVRPGAGATATFTYDGDGLRATRTGAGGAQEFTWDVSHALPLLLTDGSTSYLYDDLGLPLEQVDSSGAVLYYQHDQLGSTRLLTNAAGAVAATFAYDAYGNLARKTGTADTPLRWAGQYQDADTGLYYLRARYYDPATGQFLTRDPIASITQEPYAYVGGNPLNIADLTGLGCGWNPVCYVSQGASAAWNGVSSVGSTVWHAATDAANAALPIVHDVAGGVAVVATICAIATSETVIGGLTCGTIALGAAAVQAGTGAVLYVEGKQSGAETVFDIATLGIAGFGSLLELGARAAAEASEIAKGISLLRAAAAQEAPWFGKLGPWISSQWWALKSYLWAQLEAGLTFTGRVVNLSALGFASFGYACF
jgi:RHS repeat-associated protein